MNDDFDPFAPAADFDPFAPAADFDPFAEVAQVTPAEPFDPFASVEVGSAPPAKAAAAPEPVPAPAAVSQRVEPPAPLRASQALFSAVASEPVREARSIFAESGDCAVCGEPGGSHSVAGAPFLHQACRIVAGRVLASSDAADRAFVRRCDAAGSRRRALEGDGVAPGLLFYVPSSLSAGAL